MDLGLLYHRHQRLLRRAARLDEAREIAALAQLRDVQRDPAGAPSSGKRSTGPFPDPPPPSPAPDSRCAGSPAGACAPPSPRQFPSPPQRPSYGRRRTPASRAPDRYRRPSLPARSGSFSRRSSSSPVQGPGLATRTSTEDRRWPPSGVPDARCAAPEAPRAASSYTSPRDTTDPASSICMIRWNLSRYRASFLPILMPILAHRSDS